MSLRPSSSFGMANSLNRLITLEQPITANTSSSSDQTPHTASWFRQKVLKEINDTEITYVKVKKGGENWKLSKAKWNQNKKYIYVILCIVLCWLTFYRLWERITLFVLFNTNFFIFGFQQIAVFESARAKNMYVHTCRFRPSEFDFICLETIV